MSDNEDLLDDLIGEHSLADYNIGNDEEDELLADDLDNSSQNVPSNPRSYGRNDFRVTNSDYGSQSNGEESVVPNVEARNKFGHNNNKKQLRHQVAVPPPTNSIQSAPPTESPQLVPRTPQVRNIPDSLDKVYVPRSTFMPRPTYVPRPYNHRTTWRNPNYSPYRLVNPKPATSTPRPSFPPPGQVRPEGQKVTQQTPVLPRPTVPVTQSRPTTPVQTRPTAPIVQSGPTAPVMQTSPTSPVKQIGPMVPIVPEVQNLPRPSFIPTPTPADRVVSFEPRIHNFNTPYIPEAPLVPQVTIRQPIFGQHLPKMDNYPPQEVRMLPIQVPPGKKVLINPHFKGPFHPPIMSEGLTYIPTRIQRSPPTLSKETIEKKFGTDIDDAAEKFIAEQRSALASRAIKMFKRDPQRYIENTTISIENELVRDDDLSRRQEAFIHANRAGLRRRMRTPSPPPRRARTPPLPAPSQPARSADEESEYRRKVREQESMRDRVNRAKEIRRKKNATVLYEREKEKYSEKEKEKDKDKEREKEKPTIHKEKHRTPPLTKIPNAKIAEPKTPEIKTPETKVSQQSPERCLTPPLPPPESKKVDYDFDDLDLILNDFEGILSDDEDAAVIKDEPKKPEEKKSSAVEREKSPQVDLRTKLGAKNTKQRQKIIFDSEKDAKKREKEKVDSVKPLASTKRDAVKITKDEKEKPARVENKEDNDISAKRQRITFGEDNQEYKEDEKARPQLIGGLSRRVIIQRKDPKDAKAALGLFSRAIRNIPQVKEVIKDDTQILYEDSGDEEQKEIPTSKIALVNNLPHGMTDTRLKTLAGPDVQFHQTQSRSSSPLHAENIFMTPVFGTLGPPPAYHQAGQELGYGKRKSFSEDNIQECVRSSSIYEEI